MSEVDRFTAHPLSAPVQAAELDAFYEVAERAKGLHALMRTAIADFTELDTAIESARCPTLRARLIAMENAAYAEWQSLMQRYMRRGAGFKEESFRVEGMRREG